MTACYLQFLHSNLSYLSISWMATLNSMECGTRILKIIWFFFVFSDSSFTYWGVFFLKKKQTNLYIMSRNTFCVKSKICLLYQLISNRNQIDECETTLCHAAEHPGEFRMGWKLPQKTFFFVTASRVKVKLLCWNIQ